MTPSSFLTPDEADRLAKLADLDMPPQNTYLLCAVAILLWLVCAFMLFIGVVTFSYLAWSLIR